MRFEFEIGDTFNDFLFLLGTVIVIVVAIVH